MVESILKITASIFSYAAAKGIDAIIGKWLAYFVIAFEQQASERAKTSFAGTISNIKKNMPEKAKAWDEWRKRASET